MACGNESTACGNVLILEDRAVGDVHRFLFPIERDDAPWLGIDSVTLTFVRPDGTEFDRDAELVVPDVGEWDYETTTDDLDVSGYWTIKVTVVDENVSVRYPYSIQFAVVA